MIVPLTDDPLLLMNFDRCARAVGRTDDDGNLTSVDVVLKVQTLGSGVQRMGYRLTLDEATELRRDLEGLVC